MRGRPTPERKPWDVDIDTTKVGLERLSRALLATNTQLTDSMRLSGSFGRGISAFLRVQIPEGREDQFDIICKPIVRKPPPVLSVGPRSHMPRFNKKKTSKEVAS